MPDDELEAESRATDRLTLFSDAVVAIAITLLAIDLPVPEGGTVPLFFVTPNAWIMWIVVPLLVSRWRHIHRRKRSREAGPGPGSTAPEDSAPG